MPSWDKQFSNRIQAPRGSNGDSVGTGGNGREENYKSVKKNSSHWYGNYQFCFGNIDFPGHL